MAEIPKQGESFPRPIWNLLRTYDPPQTLFRRRSFIQYRGVEYSIVQLIEGSGWRWEIKFGDGNSKSGVTPISRAAAIRLAEYEIDRALKNGK
jgi:hypothetical protein